MRILAGLMMLCALANGALAQTKEKIKPPEKPEGKAPMRRAAPPPPTVLVGDPSVGVEYDPSWTPETTGNDVTLRNPGSGATILLKVTSAKVADVFADLEHQPKMHWSNGPSTTRQNGKDLTSREGTYEGRDVTRRQVNYEMKVLIIPIDATRLLVGIVFQVPTVDKMGTDALRAIFAKL
jgi:hypothetical protein